jgi:hypothetical protein
MLDVHQEVSKIGLFLDVLFTNLRAGKLAEAAFHNDLQPGKQ